MQRSAKRAVLAAATFSGAIVVTGIARLSDDAGSTADVIRVEIVDRCGQVVVDSDGDPQIVEIQLKPPPLEAVAEPGTVAEQLPLREPELVAVPVPADTRPVTSVVC